MAKEPGTEDSPPLNSAPAESVTAGRSTPPVVNTFFQFSLLGMLTCGYAAVLGTNTLDVYTAALGALGLALRFLMAFGVIRVHLSSRMVGALAIGYFVFAPVDFYYLSQTFLSTTVHTVFFLAVLKLLTARTQRDFAYLQVIAAMELLAASVLSANFAFFVLQTLFILLAIATFTSGEIVRACSASRSVAQSGLRVLPRRLGATTGILFVGILIMSLAAFLILPRTARAAFGRLLPQRTHLTGFSNSVTLGEIGEIQQNSTPLMHVRSYRGEGFLPVKWRGAALAEFDGRRWFNPPGEERRVPVEMGVLAVRTAVQGTRAGRVLTYQVHLGQPISDTLFFAGNPETIGINVPFLRISRGGAFHVDLRFGGRGLDYRVYAFQPDEWAEVRFTSAPLADSLREELTSLPVIDPRIPLLARNMTAGAETDVQKARAIENHLRHDYGYTLELLSKPVVDPLAYFLFERRKGHCEYFASAMAVMLRTLGIPARVATGFQSGVYNPMTGWQVVRASDAHAWVEAWLEGRGWTTFDPTPSDPSAGGSGWMSRLSLLSDTLDQFWQDSVMSYDFDRQLALFARVQQSSRNFRLPRLDEITAGLQRAGQAGMQFGMPVASAIALVLLAVLFGPRALRWWRTRSRVRRLERGHTQPSDATILYQQLLTALEKRGMQRQVWLTPLEFARTLPESQVAELVEDATAAYNELRFGGKTDAAPRMVRVLEQIEKL